MKRRKGKEQNIRYRINVNIRKSSIWMSKEYKKELYYLFGLDKSIKMTDPEIQIDHFIMIKRNIFDRQCIYNPEDIIKNHRLYKEIRNYGNWRKRHKK